MVSIQAYHQHRKSVRDYVDPNSVHPITAVKNYLLSLFPIFQWIYRYNLTWLYGDVIAGLTVGIVVVPQGMSYAKLATLSPEYGLYASFVGVFIYCFFATSKDVSIGPVAVMSLQVGRTITKVTEKYPEYTDKGPLIGVTMSLICGAVALGIGLLRLGFILEFIPIPAVMGFMTGSAFSIVVGQLPGMFGIAKRLDTKAATYRVLINFLKNLKHSNIDAAFGCVSLAILFIMKYSAIFGEKRYPKYSIYFFYMGVLRNGLIIIFATLISWGVYRHYPKSEIPASLIKTVPSGLRHVGVPDIEKNIISSLASELPVSVIVLLLEHIAISKSFGRINDYKIIPDQELIAIGVTNLIGVFFTAYPATGSFSRSALKAKCGVRTPLAGIFTGAVVLLALYAFTDAFYWIPNATLCAIIIHAVYDLIAHPRTSYKVWKVSPWEAGIFIIAVFITVFVSIEAGIYFSICASLALLLWRVAKAKGEFLGRIEYFEYINPVIINPVDGTQEVVEPKNINELVTTHSQHMEPSELTEQIYEHRIIPEPLNKVTNEDQYIKRESEINPTTKYDISSNISISSDQIRKRYKWVPMSHSRLNPALNVQPPPPGIIVFRPNESFTYPNCSNQVDHLFDQVKAQTRRGNPNKVKKLGDRPWNDHGPRNRSLVEADDPRPLLRKIVMDFSSVPYLDLTGVQNLVDIRAAINRYVDGDVEWHFVGIISPWSRRALLAEGFGRGGVLEKRVVGMGSAKPLDEESTVGIEGSTSEKSGSDINKQAVVQGSVSDGGERFVPLIDTSTPFFHEEIPDLD